MQIYDIPIGSGQKELTVLGTDGFPMAIYKTQLSKNVLGFVNWHWHEAIQLCLVLSGDIVISVDQRTYVLGEGQGCFINANTLHMIQAVRDPDSTYICVNADPSLIYGSANSILQRRYVRPFLQSPSFWGCLLMPDDQVESEILSGVRHIFQLDSQRQYGYEIETVIALLQIWERLISLWRLRPAEPFAPRGEEEARLKEILSFLQAHYHEKLSLWRVAGEIHLCTNECCRFFKRNMGRTIFEYLLEYRIEKSIDCLLTTNAPISQIALECGFSGSSHYIERFKRLMGTTPLDYRKTHLRA